MIRLEDRLREAMARRDPPPGFASRVVARAAQQAPAGAARRWTAWFERGRAWRLAGALSGILLALSGGLYQQHARELRGQAAKRQLLLAIRIVGTKLNEAHRQVLQIEEVHQ